MKRRDGGERGGGIVLAEPVDEPGPDDLGDLGLEAFCRGLRPRLLDSLALRHGHHVAEELTPETLARVYSHWDTVRGLPSPRAWAYRVAFNLGNSLFRRKLAEHRALTRTGAVPLPPELDRADVLDVRAAVTALPVGQRSALILRYYADLSVAEAAQALGCSPGTVKSQTHEGLRTLRRHLGPTLPDGAGS